MGIQDLLGKNLLIVGPTGSGKTHFLKYLADYLAENATIYVDDQKLFSWARYLTRPYIKPYDQATLSQLIAERSQNSEKDYPDVYVIFDELAVTLEWEANFSDDHQRVSPLSDPLLDWASVEECARLHIHILSATQVPDVMLSPEEIADKFDYYLEFRDKLQEEEEGYTRYVKEKLADRFGPAETLYFGERRLYIHRLGKRHA